MSYRFAWADGRLRLVPDHPDTLDHLSLFERVSGYRADEWVMGTYDSETLEVLIQQSSTTCPEEKQLRYLLECEIGHDQPVLEQSRALWRDAAGSEDTEAMGGEGFLRNPHEALYPPAFQGGQTMPESVRSQLKNRVLNELEEEFYHADQWIYFTIFGSGISYNWDERGDMDIQMWIDIDKYNEIHTGEPLTGEELLKRVRRIIALVNFPTFKDLNLSPPKDSEDECDGSMMIQFYANIGTGTKEENLAKNPYACYDLETDEWIVRPKPFDSAFFGEIFLEIEPKAKEVAIQAEALLDALERDVIDAQFWGRMYELNHNDRYENQYLDARRNAELDREGIKTMFFAIFHDRKAAYAPGGRGVEDERDTVQKLLEVWGIFQRLKQQWRQPFPWEEQELPDEPRDTEDHDDHQDDKADPEERASGWSAVVASHGEGEGDVGFMDAVRLLVELPGAKTSSWQSLMEKAQRLRADGQVHVLRNGYEHVVGRVEGDHGVYTSQIWRQDPASRTITMWDCECPWDDYAWQRTRQFKKYEGRPCSHVLALYWEALGKTLDEDTGQPGGPSAGQPVPPAVPYGQLPVGGPIPQQQIIQQPLPAQTPQPTPTGLAPAAMPGSTPAGPLVPGGANPALPAAVTEGIAGQPRADGVAPTVNMQQAPPIGYPGATSMPTKPGEGGTVSIPGAFSAWKRESMALFRGDIPHQDIYRKASEWLEQALQLGNMDIRVEFWPHHSIPGWPAPAVFALTDPITVGMDLMTGNPNPYHRIYIAVGEYAQDDDSIYTVKTNLHLLTHEFIHAAQFHRLYGDLSPQQAFDQDRFRKVIDANDMENTDYTKNYMRIPWEAEAYKWTEAYYTELLSVLNLPEPPPRKWQQSPLKWKTPSWADKYPETDRKDVYVPGVDYPAADDGPADNGFEFHPDDKWDDDEDMPQLPTAEQCPHCKQFEVEHGYCYGCGSEVPESMTDAEFWDKYDADNGAHLVDEGHDPQDPTRPWENDDLDDNDEYYWDQRELRWKRKGTRPAPEIPDEEKWDPDDNWKKYFGSWKLGAVFENGQSVRTNHPVQGIDRDDVTWDIPRNAHGEVLNCDEVEAVVIFPLKTGPLQSHLVRVTAPPSTFSAVDSSPFIRRRR